MGLEGYLRDLSSDRVVISVLEGILSTHTDLSTCPKWGRGVLKPFNGSHDVPKV